MNIVIIPNLDAPNLNGRIYTKQLAEQIIKQHSEPIFGQIGLPNGLNQDLSEVTHKVTNLRIEGNDLVGTKWNRD